jgi:DNA-binding transcriptional regulator LsrR (DeoR family)
MAKENKRLEAEKLYVKSGLSCASIAERLDVSEGTVYRWKAEAAEKSEALDWEAQRRVYNMSHRELFAIYTETVKNWIVQIQRNPELLADGKIADSIVKHISVLQKLDTRGQYKGVALELLKIINQWLAENQPELKARLDPYWDSIFEALVEYTADKGMF